MVLDPPVGALREYLDQTLDRLALPGTNLVRMDLLCCEAISYSVRSPRSASSATFAFSSPENLRRLLLICIVWTPPGWQGPMFV